MGDFQTFDGGFLTDGAAFAADPDCCCEPITICNVDTSNDLDVFFDDIVDCGLGAGDCTALNNKTFRTVWNGSLWTITDIPSGLTVTITKSPPTFILRAFFTALPGEFCYFKNTNCAPLPQTINNSFVIGSCAPLTIEGHDGFAIISVA